MDLAGWVAVAAGVWVVAAVAVGLLVGGVIRIGQGPREDVMPAIKWDIKVEQGSREPQYIVLRHPVPEGSPPGTVGALIDLTAPGYSVHGVVATRPDRSGTVLVDLPDNSVWRRTNTGRLYFDPSPTVTSAWAWRRGFLQIELTHPSGDVSRVASGRVSVSPELVV